MKKLLLLLFIVLLSCGNNWNVLKDDRQQTVSEIKELEQGISYFKDIRPEPDLCYAYFWGGTVHGGPALANVPCDAVKDLLVR